MAVIYVNNMCKRLGVVFTCVCEYCWMTKTKMFQSDLVLVFNFGTTVLYQEERPIGHQELAPY